MSRTLPVCRHCLASLVCIYPLGNIKPWYQPHWIQHALVAQCRSWNYPKPWTEQMAARPLLSCSLWGPFLCGEPTIALLLHPCESAWEICSGTPLRICETNIIGFRMHWLPRMYIKTATHMPWCALHCLSQLCCAKFLFSCEALCCNSWVLPSVYDSLLTIICLRLSGESSKTRNCAI